MSLSAASPHKPSSSAPDCGPSSNMTAGNGAGDDTPGTAPDAAASARQLERVWERVQARLRAELGEDVYTSWFSSAMLDSSADGQVCLSVATRFLKHWIEHNFGSRLLELWAIEGQGVQRIAIHVRTGARRVAPVQSAADRLMPDAATTTATTRTSTSRIGPSTGQRSASSTPAQPT